MTPVSPRVSGGLIDSPDHRSHTRSSTTVRETVGELRTFVTSIPDPRGIPGSLACGKRPSEIQLTPAGEAVGLTTAMSGR